MKKELEAMTKEELVEVCNHYGLYKPETMTKKKMINKILELNHISTKEEKDVKMKTTNGNKLYMFAFLLIIISLFVMSISTLFTTFYFKGNLFQKGNYDVYGTVLTVASFAGSVFIYYSGMKTGTLNMFMVIMMLFSFAGFIFFLMNYHKNIEVFNKVTNLGALQDKADLYKTMFGVWVGIPSSLIVISVATFSIRKIMY